jgi:hypothetical protein
MIRFSKLLICIVGLSIAGTFAASDVSAQTYMPETFNENQFVEYERQLNAILKTRRDEEKQFVAKVVVLVRMGRIPSRLVSTSYQWALKNRPDTNYPFIYFEKVLRIQARALELDNEIPVFDYKIYKSAGQQVAGQKASAGQRTQANRNFFSRRPSIR